MPKFCPTCGEPLQFENAEICPKCGVRLVPPEPSARVAGMQPSGQHLVIGIALILAVIVLAAVLLYLGLSAGPSAARAGTVTPAVTSAALPAARSTHTPSEIFQSHLGTGEEYSITTRLADPATTRYTVKLVGPDNADFDLYIRKEGSPNRYDYSSQSTGSTEQIDVLYPAIGNYTVTVHPNRGSGDFVLYIDYGYRS